MSAGQTSEYRVICPLPSNVPFPYVLQTCTLDHVDVFRTRASALSACRALNEGRAVVDSHAIVGCKVIQREKS